MGQPIRIVSMQGTWIGCLVSVACADAEGCVGGDTELVLVMEPLTWLRIVCLAGCFSMYPEGLKWAIASI